MTAVRFLKMPLMVPAALCAVLFLVGCENMHPANIPPQAMLTTEGSGIITATAPHDGTAYVYDVNADRLIYSGAVARGQVVTVNTTDNKVVVDGQTKTDRTLNQWNKHRIYFDNNPVLEKHVITEETRMSNH